MAAYSTGPSSGTSATLAASLSSSSTTTPLAAPSRGDWQVLLPLPPSLSHNNLNGSMSRLIRLEILSWCSTTLSLTSSTRRLRTKIACKVKEVKRNLWTILNHSRRFQDLKRRQIFFFSRSRRKKMELTDLPDSIGEEGQLHLEGSQSLSSSAAQQLCLLLLGLF